MPSLLRVKPMSLLTQEASETGEHTLKRSLGALNLITLGIGAIIGAGIFVLTGHGCGQVRRTGGGAELCSCGHHLRVRGLCYAEFASIIPIAGSAYTYGYATLGELVAWIIGWDLVPGVRLWRGYGGFGLVRILQQPAAAVPHLHSARSHDYRAMCWSKYHEQWMPLMTSFHPAWISRAAACDRNLQPDCGGDCHGDHHNAGDRHQGVGQFQFCDRDREAWHRGRLPGCGWLLPLQASGSCQRQLAPVHSAFRRTRELRLGRHPRGAARIFFAYIGFDAVSTAAQEAKNPQKDMPIGILGSLAVCTVLYILVSTVLTGLVPYKHAERGCAGGSGHRRDRHRLGLDCMVKVGAVFGLATVMLVMLLGQTRVFYLDVEGWPAVEVGFGHSSAFRTPWITTIVFGAFAAIMPAFLPIDNLADLVNIGTLLAFTIVCAGVWVLRVRHPDLHRPFKTPLVPLVPILGILSAGYLMTQLAFITWAVMIGWLIFGLIIYFGYS
jgi:APA family basic amino acid/polyamine antiporter